MTAKRNRLDPNNIESLIVIKENMAMVEYFLRNGGYEIEKSEDNSNPFKKINIEGQERHDDPEEYFNSEKDNEEEEFIIYWRTLMIMILIVMTKMLKKMDSRFH